MKIAVPYENGAVFGHFGHTAQFKIYTAENGVLTDARVLPTNGSGHSALAGFLTAAGVDTLICGGIGAGAKQALAAANITVYGGTFSDADVAAYCAEYYKAEADKCRRILEQLKSDEPITQDIEHDSIKVD